MGNPDCSKGSGFIQDLRFRFRGSGFRAQGLRFALLCLEFGMLAEAGNPGCSGGLGFRV